MAGSGVSKIFFINLICIAVSHGNKVHLGIRRTCNEITCPKGFVARMCDEGYPDSTACVPCPDGTFMNVTNLSTEHRRCITKRVCSLKEGKVLVHDHDNTRDRQCRCSTEDRYYDPEFDPSHSDRSPGLCIFCHQPDHYVAMDKGCIECIGKIKTDEHGYKHCVEMKLNHMVTTDGWPTMSRSKTDSAEEGMSSTSMPDEEETTTPSKMNDKYVSSLNKGIIIGVPIAIAGVVGIIIVVILVVRCNNGRSSTGNPREEKKLLNSGEQTRNGSVDSHNQRANIHNAATQDDDSTVHDHQAPRMDHPRRVDNTTQRQSSDQTHQNGTAQRVPHDSLTQTDSGLCPSCDGSADTAGDPINSSCQRCADRQGRTSASSPGNHGIHGRSASEAADRRRKSSLESGDTAHTFNQPNAVEGQMNIIVQNSVFNIINEASSTKTAETSEDPPPPKASVTCQPEQESSPADVHSLTPYPVQEQGDTSQM